MSAIADKGNNCIDVICQHTRDGNIIPLRIRVKDEDGMFQTFTIKSYKELQTSGQYVSQFGNVVHNHTWAFACKIQVFDTLKQVRIFYNSNENLWRITGILS